MNARELADILGVHAETIRRQIKSGKIEAVRKGRNLEIPEHEVERVLAENELINVSAEKKKAVQFMIREIDREIQGYLDMIHDINATVNTPKQKGDTHNQILKTVEYAKEISKLENIKVRLKKGDSDA